MSLSNHALNSEFYIKATELKQDASCDLNGDLPAFSPWPPKKTFADPPPLLWYYAKFNLSFSNPNQILSEDVIFMMPLGWNRYTEILIP